MFDLGENGEEGSMKELRSEGANSFKQGRGKLIGCLTLRGNEILGSGKGGGAGETVKRHILF